MLRSTLVSILIALATSLPAFAQDGPVVQERPSHYTVRFGATIGELEPVAGEVLCARDRDCEILLAFVPKVTIRLRADPDRVRSGRASISCADLQCVFDIEAQEIHYNSKVNDLHIWTGQGRQPIHTLLVWHPRTLLGRFTFVVDAEANPD